MTSRRRWVFAPALFLSIVAAGCGGKTNIATEQNSCATVAACVEGGHASKSVDQIETLTGSQYRFVSGVSYPFKDGSVWTLRLKFVNDPTNTLLEDDLRNDAAGFTPCDGASPGTQSSRTPGGRSVCVEPASNTTIVWYISGGLVHSVYRIPPLPKMSQQEIENILFGYVDALR